MLLLGKSERTFALTKSFVNWSLVVICDRKRRGNNTNHEEIDTFLSLASLFDLASVERLRTPDEMMK